MRYFHYIDCTSQATPFSVLITLYGVLLARLLERGVDGALSILEELNNLIDGCGFPVETGVFSGAAPDAYVVITPLSDTFGAFADNRPQAETQEARLSLYDKGNYTAKKNTIVRALLGADFIITDRRFIEREDDTGYFHYSVDAAKIYEME